MTKFQEVNADVSMAWGTVYKDIPEAKKAWQEAEETWNDFLDQYENLSDEEYYADKAHWERQYHILYDLQDHAKYRLEALEEADKALRKACQALDDLVWLGL